MVLKRNFVVVHSWVDFVKFVSNFLNQWEQMRIDHDCVCFCKHRSLHSSRNIVNRFLYLVVIYISNSTTHLCLPFDGCYAHSLHVREKVPSHSYYCGASGQVVLDCHISIPCCNDIINPPICFVFASAFYYYNNPRYAVDPRAATATRLNTNRSSSIIVNLYISVP